MFRATRFALPRSHRLGRKTGAGHHPILFLPANPITMGTKNKMTANKISNALGLFIMAVRFISA
jgi:hypothetical protein